MRPRNQYIISIYVLSAFALCCQIIVWNNFASKTEENSGSTIAQTALEINQQPNGYPWNAVVGPQHQNFSLLWERVMQPDLPLMPQVGKLDPPLYAIFKGKFFVWKGHKSRRNHFRVSFYEQLILESLNLAKRAVRFLQTSNRSAIIDSRILDLVTQPIPFFVDFGDFRKCWDKTYPIFTYATFPDATIAVVDGEEQLCIPIGIPGYHGNPRSQQESSWDATFEMQNKNYAWHTKIDAAIWRGSTTGNGYLVHGDWTTNSEIIITGNWRDLPRVQFVNYSHTSQNINAGFYLIVQRNSTEVEEIKNSGLMKDAISLQDFQKYKAIIDIDGNSWSSRFGSLLCMNSVVLKIQPDWVDYSYSELEPFAHYIPVHKNLSNLQEMVNLVIDDKMSSRMQTIVQNANLWCKNKFTPSQPSIDMVWIMISYFEMLKEENKSSGNFTTWKEHLHKNSRNWNMKRNWDPVARKRSR